MDADTSYGSSPGGGAGSGSGTSSGTSPSPGPCTGVFPLPFPPREFADRGTKWLVSHPAHLRHVLRVVALEVAELLDFDGMEPVLTEQVSEPVLKQMADRIFRVPLRPPASAVANAEAAAHPNAPPRHATVVVLVEHQSTVEPLQSLRMLSYMVRLWDLERLQGALPAGMPRVPGGPAARRERFRSAAVPDAAGFRPAGGLCRGAVQGGAAP